MNSAYDHQIRKSAEEVSNALHTSHVDQCNWYVDSTCTRHMAINDNLFVTLYISYITKPKLGNGAYMQGQGRGLVKFPTDESGD